jgi:hypothetical protein
VRSRDASATKWKIHCRTASLSFAPPESRRKGLYLCLIRFAWRATIVRSWDATLVLHFRRRLARHWPAAATRINRRDHRKLFHHESVESTSLFSNSCPAHCSGRRAAPFDRSVESHSGSSGCVCGDLDRFLAHRRPVDAMHRCTPSRHFSHDRTRSLVHGCPPLR